MSKKSILSTLLISSALLGTISASAATSAIKPEKKLVSVEKSNAKIYKNSKLQESKKAKKGTVYKVDGYRNINSKKYYRVYQEDTKGKVVYKGYILDKDTKVLKGQKPAKKDRLVALTKDDQTAWKSLYFNKKIKTYDGTKHSSNFEVKYSYNIGGKKYFSLYRGEKWMGYMDGSAFKVLTPKHLASDKQDYKVVKDYETYNDIYFTEKGQLKVGEKVKVKNIYTFGTGRQYGSIYNKDGKWLGYANMKALEAVETSTPDKPVTPPEKPEEKPDGNKPGTGGDTSKPDTKPDNPEDKPTDKPDGDKPGQGGGNKPGGDQGGSGSGDTGNKPGDGGTGDSGSGNQPGGGDQGGSGDTGTGGDQPSQPDQPGQPDNPGTGGGDTETPEQPKPEKPSDAEVKALQDAVDKAKKVVEAQDKLDGVEPVKHALEKAEKILEKSKKGEATKAEVTTATKEIEAAIKGITLKPSVNKDSIEKLHAAIEQLKETQKLGAGNLVNNDKYNEVLKEAQKVLDDAVLGKADKAKIEEETKKVNDFINKLELNTKALEAKIEDVKAKGDKVYMTQEQEKSFNDFIEAAKKAAENKKLSNTDKLKAIDENLKKAEDFIKGQPTEADVKELIKATQKEQEVATQLKGKEDQIFQNWNDVKTKDEVADKMLAEIKEDKSPQENNATVEHTAKEVQEAAKSLMDSMANLEVNHDNLRKYDEAAKAAIAELDSEHKEAAQGLLDDFEGAARGAKVEDLDSMAKKAKRLNDEIHKDQVEEINSVIEKAKRIEGVSSEDQQGNEAPNAKFYESDSYGQMNTTLEQAEAAEKKLKGETKKRSKRSTNVGATQVQNGKEAAAKEKELKDKIKSLTVKDWQTQEINGQLQLVKYKGDYSQTIEIPGSLKDEQVIINTTDQPLFSEGTRKESSTVEVKFEENTNRKVKAVDSLKGAFSNNTNIKSVDFTGLDTSKVKDFSEAFKGATALTTVKGLKVGATVTDIHGMFANSGLTTIDFAGWDTSKVTDVSSLFDGANKLTAVNGKLDLTTATNFDHMFGGTTTLTTLDFSEWHFGKALQETMNNMFISGASAKKDGEKTGLTTVTLPNEFSGNNAPEGIVKALESAGKKGQLSSDVKVNRAEGQQVGTVNTSGTWKKFPAEESTQKGETIVSDEATLKDAPKLARAILTSDKASTEAKKLAGVVDAGYKVDKNSTGNKEKSIAKLDNNLAWHEFGANGKGSYYDALKDLQDYARNTASVDDTKLQKDATELSKDMDDLRVLTDYLDEAMKEAQKAEASAKEAHVEGSEVETTDQLIDQAKVIIADKDGKQRELEDWNTINKLTAKLKEAAKKLTTIVKK